jgi:hypothetical protein
VRNLADGAGWVSGNTRSKRSTNQRFEQFEAPTEAVSAGFLS